MKFSRTFILVHLVSILVLSPIISTRAVAGYVPAVTPGQWAEYKPLYNICDAPDPSICQSTGNTIPETDYGALQVVSTYGTTVTLKLITVYKNGTGTQQGVMVNVETGVSNVTTLTGTPTDYFVLAGGLQEPDKIWSTDSAPTLNTTLTETVLGASRVINFLNYTSSYTSIYGSFSSSSGFAFDQERGIFVEFSLSYSFTSSVPNGNYRFAVALGMVDNNIWRSSSLPDFTLTANPATVNTSQDSPGTSTITVTRSNGFSATVKLTAHPSSNGITCSFSASSIPAGGSDTSTLSCSGSPGTYTVVVTGNSGYSTQTTSVSMNVAGSTNPATSSQPFNNLSMLLVFAGIGIVAIVAVLAAYFLLRRKPVPPAVAPSETMPPATPA